MKSKTEQPVLPFATETVWDGGRSATGVCGEGRELSVGRESGQWLPEHLLLLAAESSLMESFLAAAREADIEVLGYVSSGHLEIPDEPDAAPRLTLKPCIVVASVEEAERAALLSTAVARTSMAGRLLGNRLRVGLDVRLEPSA
jgi:organic hydroperoxide reductase OsmC/OhrA